MTPTLALDHTCAPRALRVIPPSGPFHHPSDPPCHPRLLTLPLQVTRLWRQRGIYRARCREAMDHLRKVQAAVDDVDQDFT